ncbi:S9 family peptidase [Sphingomonas colocasiae]|uniref:S9 family peptidase n=2 Tax=Sphingomonas colocasiae TaxID=1848973 RepID=A0ABS7PY47_9SPHN|nr:S9 family peptidase [Sphingomonas colocasiae]
MATAITRAAQAAAALSICSGAAATPSPAPRPPVAEKRPHEIRAPFGAVRNDEYYWLRDDSRKDPDVLGYLQAENAYADVVLAGSRPLRETLYREMVARVKPDQSSLPYLRNGYLYYSRFTPGADYPVAARRKGDMDAPEQILLDMPVMAKGHGYFSATELVASPDNRLLAYAEDTVGRLQYSLKIKDLESGKLLSDQVTNVQPNFLWSNDGRTIFYIDKNPVTLRSQRIMAHDLGSPVSADRLVYEEKDESYYIHLGRTSDGRHLCIRSEATLTAEVRCAPADNPARFKVIVPREKGVFYRLDHQDGRWIARTNKDAPNFRIATARDADIGTGWSAWSDIVAASDQVVIEDAKAFATFLAIEERVDANKRIRLLDNSGQSIVAKADESAFTMRLSVNESFDTPWARYTYHSLVTPQRTYELNAATGERRLLKAEGVPGHDPSNYALERIWATARDGTKIPVTLAYAKGFRRDGSAPIYQYAYGTYGASLDLGFEPFLPSLLDRGIVYAFAHIRGGGELGKAWADGGRTLKKMNTFTDFIDVTRHLVDAGYGAKGRVMAVGESAGGALMGAVANMAPQEYRAIVAQVPFVDGVTTMLDPTIPLVTNEYEEWGNPANKRDYDYILNWSPYDNVRAQDYPAMFVGTGLWDSQVQYYEPAKWVARLRATKTDHNPLVFRTGMEAGHGGRSGRFQRYVAQAEYIAFGLERLGVTR